MFEQQKAELRAAGRFLLENRLTWGNAGNLSLRLDDEHFLITASGTQLGALESADLLRFPDANPPRKPSKETPMHAAIYDARPEIDAVLHASPFYSTLVACSDVAIPNNLFIENMYYLERVARVRYEHAGSAELGRAVAEQATNANILLLENHGVLVYDSSFKEALMALQTLEYTCQMLITARSAGIELTHLPPATVTDFLHNAGYRPRREWPI